jgi:hypothetical protein
MFNLVYLPADKKRAIEKLQDRLSKTTSAQVRNETLLLIQELEAEAKPYQQCDLYEADELRSQLLNKINTLARLGKSVEPFLLHLRDVDFHIQTLQMRESLREQEKFKAPEEPPNLRDKSVSLAKIARDKKRKEAFGRHRWQIGFEDESE